MDDEKTESYRTLYRVRPLIYHIGDLRLWMPIRQDGVVLWLLYIIVFFIFCYMLPILAWLLPFDRTITMVVGPIAAAYYTVKLDPAGKSVPRYVRDILHFLVRPKWVIRWQAIRQPKGKQRMVFAGCCRPYDRISLSDGSVEWCGGSGWLSGTVEGLHSLVLPAHVHINWRGRSQRLIIKPLKRISKRAVISPVELERKERQTLRFATKNLVQINKRKTQDDREIWQFRDVD